MIRGEIEVFKFSRFMLAKLNLPRNAGKGSWLNCKKIHLLWRLSQECCELAWALVDLYFAERRFIKATYPWTSDIVRLRTKKENVADEAADVANFAMMLADKVGGL